MQLDNPQKNIQTNTILIFTILKSRDQRIGGAYCSTNKSYAHANPAPQEVASACERKEHVGYIVPQVVALGSHGYPSPGFGVQHSKMGSQQPPGVQQPIPPITFFCSFLESWRAPATFIIFFMIIEFKD
jgi:hypothetical protein